MSSSTRFLSTYPRGAVSDVLKKSFDEKKLLFYIEKSQNHNAVVYEANVVTAADGTKHLEESNPVEAYWILYARDPIIEEGLNMVERNTAYGKTVAKSKDPTKQGHYTLTLAALKHYEVDVFLDQTGNVHALIKIEEKPQPVELLSVYVETTTSWGIPKVHHIDIKYRDPNDKDSLGVKRIVNT